MGKGREIDFPAPEPLNSVSPSFCPDLIRAAPLGVEKVGPTEAQRVGLEHLP